MPESPAPGEARVAKTVSIAYSGLGVRRVTTLPVLVDLAARDRVTARARGWEIPGPPAPEMTRFESIPCRYRCRRERA